jgi:hypothetical protein
MPCLDPRRHLHLIPQWLRWREFCLPRFRLNRVWTRSHAREREMGLVSRDHQHFDYDYLDLHQNSQLYHSLLESITQRVWNWHDQRRWVLCSFQNLSCYLVSISCRQRCLSRPQISDCWIWNLHQKADFSASRSFGKQTQQWTSCKRSKNWRSSWWSWLHLISC